MERRGRNDQVRLRSVLLRNRIPWPLLVAQRAVSQAELDKALSFEKAAAASVDADQAALDNANLNLRWTTVTSPISGIAGVAKVAIGDLITPTTVMTTAGIPHQLRQN